MKQETDNQTEELAKIFSLKLADKLEKEEISLQEMTILIGKFFILLNTTKTSQEIINFIENI